MDKEYWEKKQVIVYWWNMGKKTLDYHGPVKGFLEKKDITVRSFKKAGFWGWRFKVSVGSSRIVYETPRDNYYARATDEVIKMFLSVMGDKAQVQTERGFFRVNWR